MEQAKNSVDYNNNGGNHHPPIYSNDILAPPQWNGPPGGLIPWSTTSAVATSKYSIFGTDSQVLQMVLMPGESVTSEPGSMTYRSDLVLPSTGMDGCGNGCKRCLGGESMFRNTYTNRGGVPASITFSPSFPAKIVPIDLSRSGTFYASPGLWLCHLGDVKVSFKFVKNLVAGCCGGAGFLLLKLSGTGTVFLNGGGTVCEKILAQGEVLLIDSNSLLGFAESAGYDVQCNSNLFVCCCSGEGLFNAKVTGPGLAIVQSMSLKRLKAAIAPAAAAAAAGAAGAASQNAASSGGGGSGR